MRVPRRVAVAVGALFIVLVSACRSTSGPAAELAAARQRWTERGPASYEMTVTRGCECVPEAVGPVIVTVRGSAVESRRYTASA